MLMTMTVIGNDPKVTTTMSKWGLVPKALQRLVLVCLIGWKGRRRVKFARYGSILVGAIYAMPMD